MEINLTQQEIKFLKQFAKKQQDGAKDNVGTLTPIHVVERKHKHFVEDGSDEAWIDPDNEYEEFESFDDLVEARIKRGENLPPYGEVKYEDVNDVWIDDQKSYCKAYGINAYSGRYVESHQPVAFFLILDEAKRYKNGYQSHNCGDCRVYTYGLGYSNTGDMPTFRALLMRLGQQLITSEETKGLEVEQDGKKRINAKKPATITAKIIVTLARDVQCATKRIN